MNYTKIIIPAIAVIIGIVIISTINFESENNEPIINEDSKNDINQNSDNEVNLFENELKSTDEIIQEKLDEIEKNKLENVYQPKDREWITSGPFQIDRSEYILGEKVFLRIGGLSNEEIGQVVFLRPSNATHYSVYASVPFDGANKPSFNYYIEPDLSLTREICTVDDLIGDWKVVFRGTDYPNLEFRVTEQILPGDEEHYEPVC